MEKFNKSMFILGSLEHEHNPQKVLHKNPKETGLTFYGIYQTAHPTLSIWNIIHRYLEIEPDLKKCGQILLNNRDIMNALFSFYKREFWDKMKLDLIQDQKKCDEMFIFGVNTHWKTASKVAQEIVGLTGKDIDGFIGPKSIEKINAFDVDIFDKEFDIHEMAHYDDIIERKPHLAINYKGWKKRAYYVKIEKIHDTYIV